MAWYVSREHGSSAVDVLCPGSGTQQGETYGYGVVYHLDVSGGVATFATLSESR
jgi:hypothetical protein